MPSDAAALLVQCQLALDLTQTQLGELLGRDRRTIQRWQDKGFSLSPAESEAFARVLRAVRPDLADDVLALSERSAALLATTPPAAPAVIEAILGAAAEAGALSPEATRPIVTAAFKRAGEMGAAVEAVIAGLKANG